MSPFLCDVAEATKNISFVARELYLYRNLKASSNSEPCVTKDTEGNGNDDDDDDDARVEHDLEAKVQGEDDASEE